MEIDDRMPPENLKQLAHNLMAQGSRVVESRGGSSERRAVAGMFEGKARSVQRESVELDLSPLGGTQPHQFFTRDELEAMPVNRPTRVNEDLVSQAAQSLVRDQNDAFLAITQRMTPDEVLMALNTARQWRRPSEDWQKSFKSAPESGFKFIDRNPKGKNTAESLARKIAGYIREQKIPAEESPRVVRKLMQSHKIPPMNERQLALFSGKVAALV